MAPILQLPKNLPPDLSLTRLAHIFRAASTVFVTLHNPVLPSIDHLPKFPSIVYPTWTFILSPAYFLLNLHVVYWVLYSARILSSSRDLRLYSAADITGAFQFANSLSLF